MSINKLVLETDGLVVGTNQLVASGGGVSIANNLVVSGNTYSNVVGTVNTSNLTVTGNGATFVNSTPLYFGGTMGSEISISWNVSTQSLDFTAS
jgi:hypothetical protein